MKTTIKLNFRNGESEIIETSLETMREDIRETSKGRELFNMVTLDKIEKLVLCVG